MHFYLGFLLLCVTCLPALAENNDLVQYCEKCLEKSLVSGYYEHPMRCDGYVQCQYINKTMTAYEMFCNEGTCYDKETQNCDFCSNIKCDKKCDRPTKFKMAYSCNKYYICDSLGFNFEPQSCQDYERFDEKTSSCIPDITCRKPDAYKGPCSDTFRESKTLGNFWQKDAEGWIEKECGLGTAFDDKTCTCSKMITVTPPKTCMLVNLPLKSDYIELSHNWYVKNVGNVKFSNNAAVFSDESALVIPALTNNDLGNSAEIQMDFYFKRSSSDSFAIVSNGNCGRKPTISIRIENAKTSFPTVVGVMKLKGNAIPVQISAKVQLDQWFSIRFGKLLDKVRMYLDGVLVEEKKVPGHIETIDSAVSIGIPCSSNSSFVGSVKEFKITKCPQW